MNVPISLLEIEPIMPRAVRRTKKIHNTTPTKTSASDTVHGSPGIPTTTGLLGLPVELFEMVLSEYHDISTDTILSNPTSLPKESGERIKVLRVLSQTCRALRTSCLPRAWERLEACIEHTDGVWYKQVSGNLERKCNGLTATPEIAKLVKYALQPFLLVSLLIRIAQSCDRRLDTMFNLHRFNRLRKLLGYPSELTHASSRTCTLSNDICAERSFRGQIVSTDSNNRSPFVRPQHPSILPRSQECNLQRRRWVHVGIRHESIM